MIFQKEICEGISLIFGEHDMPLPKNGLYWNFENRTPVKTKWHMGELKDENRTIYKSMFPAYEESDILEIIRYAKEIK